MKIRAPHPDEDVAQSLDRDAEIEPTRVKH
jgi:hypothetical protein